jgi:hypothetical protein
LEAPLAVNPSEGKGLVMKSLVFCCCAFICQISWAGVNQFQYVLAHPDVQSAIPQAGLIKTTVTAGEVRNCRSDYQISAAYAHETCDVKVGISTCAQDPPIIGARVCEETGIFIKIADTDVYSFEKDIRPVFQDKCTKCHGAGKMKPTDYTDYDAAVAHKDDLMKKVVNSTNMPMGTTMDGTLRAKVGQWISGGTPK